MTTLPERLLSEASFWSDWPKDGGDIYVRPDGAADMAALLREAAQALQAQEGDLLDALRTLHRLGQFDNVYDVRARADLSILRDDQSSWDHPDVIAYSEACKVIESYLAAALPLR